MPTLDEIASGVVTSEMCPGSHQLPKPGTVEGQTAECAVCGVREMIGSNELKGLIFRHMPGQYGLVTARE